MKYKIIVMDKYLNDLLNILSHKYNIPIVTVESYGVQRRANPFWNMSAIIVKPKIYHIPLILLFSSKVINYSEPDSEYIYRMWKIKTKIKKLKIGSKEK